MAPSSLKHGFAALSLAGTFASIAATTPPTYPGYTLLWDADFAGSSGASPSSSDWHIITGYLGVNAELEEYTSSTRNVQLSGGGTLQLVPWADPSTAYGWTSGRVESVASWAPAPGAVTRAEAEIDIDLGGAAASTAQGLWPAFWMLPESFRAGAQPWPGCGELDILEAVDGLPTGYGTAHCGGECGDDPDGAGVQGSVAVGGGPHVWRLEWDRTAAAAGWQAETIRWSVDGDVFHTITGGDFAEAVWDNLAHQPYYFILNMAVGGTWPGNPNSATVGGYGAMMEVSYVAIYQT